ncbi:MAG TPA: hypothetical protein VGJ93_10370 [Desulfuromonadaceae bacterium]|jgi:hypothetical protein
MRIKKFSMMLLSAISLAALLNGCGSSSKEGSTNAALDAVPKVNEQLCIGCHSSWVEKNNPTENIVAAYTASKHFAVGKGCQDCHGGGAEHNGVGPIPYPNPDTGGKCYACHKPYLNAAHVYTGTLPLPGKTPAAGQQAAQYISTYNNPGSQCTICHAPHRSILPQNAQWAESGHGTLVVAAKDGTGFTHYDFKQADRAGAAGDTISNSFSNDCVRCHTSTGYLNYVNNGGDIHAFGNATDTMREVLQCNVCHVDNGFKRLRQVGAFTGDKIYYNDNTKNIGLHTTIQFPDKGASNICINCHAGRQIGDNLKKYPAAFFNSTTLTQGGPHHAPTVAMILGATLTNGRGTGFEFYSSYKYQNLSYYQHDLIGTSSAEAPTGTSGPCAGCHFNASGFGTKDHTLVAAPTTVGVTPPVCAKCHTAAFGGMDLTSYTTQKNNFLAARKALKMLVYSSSYGKTGIKAARGAVPTKSKLTWNTAGPKKADARNGLFMYGATFNAILFYETSSAFVHNNNYSKLLIKDSIDWVYGTTRSAANVKAAICELDTTNGRKAPDYDATTNPETWTATTDSAAALGFLGIAPTTCP